MEYELQQEIGRGSYGAVFRAVHRETGGVYAVKRIDDSGRPTMRSFAP